MSPHLRYIAAVILYAGTRAVLVPLAVTGAPLVAVVFVCLCSGACWRVLVSQFSTSSLVAPWRSHSPQIAWVSAFSTTGALVGTMVAGWFYTAPAPVWAAASLLILVALAVPVVAAGGLSGNVSQIVTLVYAQLADRAREGAHAPVSRLPVALLAASFVATVASTALPRLGVVVVALVASPAWVGPASLFAALAAFAVPLVVARADGWSLRAVSAFSVLSAAVWVVAPVGVVAVVACWAVSSFVGGVVDGQVDSRAAAGSDPSASLARLQTAQAFVAAGTGLVVAPMLEVLSPASLAAAVSGFVLLGTCVVSYVESRFPVV